MVSFQRYLLIGVMLCLLPILACRGGRRAPAQEADVEMRQPEESRRKPRKARQAADAYPQLPEAATSIPPGTCRLIGKIVAILPEKSPDRQSPCSQVSCRALVQVQRILGYGSAFGAPLSKGQKIKVYFIFTLSPTQKYFPALSPALPGLKVGSLFEADVPAPPQPGADLERWFQIGLYKAR